MDNRIIKSILNIVLFLCFGQVQSQSLMQLEKEAYEQNALLKALMLEYEASLTKVDQVVVWQGPQLTAAIPILPVETRLGAQRLKIGASQMFPWFGVADAKREVFISMSKDKYEEARAVQLDISYMIRSAYFRLYEIEEKQKILDKNISLFESLERISLSKVESGKANLSDVLRIQLKRQELITTHEIMENRKTVHEAEINRLTGRSMDSSVNIIDTFDLAALLIDRAELMADVSETHPRIKQLDWMIKASNDKIDLNNVSGKPVFGFGVEYALVTPRTDASPMNNGRDIIMPKISASIPLQRKQFNARNSEEQFLQLALEERKEWIVDEFEAEIEKVLAEYRETILKGELISIQKELASSAIEILLSAYSAEGKNIDELLQLENELLALEIGWVETVTASQLSKAKIERLKTKN